MKRSLWLPAAFVLVQLSALVADAEGAATIARYYGPDAITFRYEAPGAPQAPAAAPECERDSLLGGVNCVAELMRDRPGANAGTAGVRATLTVRLSPEINEYSSSITIRMQPSEHYEFAGNMDSATEQAVRADGSRIWEELQLYGGSGNLSDSELDDLARRGAARVNRQFQFSGLGRLKPDFPLPLRVGFDVTAESCAGPLLVDNIADHALQGWNILIYSKLTDAGALVVQAGPNRRFLRTDGPLRLAVPFSLRFTFGQPLACKNHFVKIGGKTVPVWPVDASKKLFETPILTLVNGTGGTATDVPVGADESGKITVCIEQAGRSCGKSKDIQYLGPLTAGTGVVKTHLTTRLYGQRCSGCADAVLQSLDSATTYAKQGISDGDEFVGVTPGSYRLILQKKSYNSGTDLFDNDTLSPIVIGPFQVPAAKVTAVRFDAEKHFGFLVVRPGDSYGLIRSDSLRIFKDDGKQVTVYDELDLDLTLVPGRYAVEFSRSWIPARVEASIEIGKETEITSSVRRLRLTVPRWLADAYETRSVTLVDGAGKSYDIAEKIQNRCYQCALETSIHIEAHLPPGQYRLIVQGKSKDPNLRKTVDSDQRLVVPATGAVADIAVIER